MDCKHHFRRNILALLERLVKAVERYLNVQPHLTGGFQIMFIVEADHADTRYSITPASAVDSEGNAIPDAQLTYEVVSDNPASVEITPDTDNTLAGGVHFGAPGLANVNATVKFGETLLGSFGAQFTITAGDPAAITGGGIAFEGLTES
jgi:hypothetical protein